MIITLTTDFGLRDPFVGIMKGVILGIAPQVEIVDLTHDIDSFDILDGAFLLNSAFRHFPAGTIHIAVVDPGVGSARRPLAAEIHGQRFLAPDNGILSYILDSEHRDSHFGAYHITNHQLFKNPVSRTFHGRDIFAPVGAHLAMGMPIDAVGPQVGDYIRKALPRPRATGQTGIVATVLRVDKFGNVITNLRPHHLEKGFRIHIQELDVTRMYQSYAEAEAGEFFAIEGSSGYIEIALNQASAAARLAIQRGTEIEVETTVVNH